MNGADLVQYVTCEEPYHWNEAADKHWYEYAGNADRRPQTADGATSFHVVAYDYGIKHNILRLLTSRGCRVTIVPAQMTADEVLALNPDGIFLSNGPGDPAAVTYGVENIRNLLGKNRSLEFVSGIRLSVWRSAVTRTS